MKLKKLEFIQTESLSGLFLFFAAILAICIENSSLSFYYTRFLAMPIAFHVGSFVLAKSLLQWINDGLMAIFFLVVGLEIKREILEGELNTWHKAALPCFAAFGGMLIPSLIYAYINKDNALALRGWAIPAATDIAFALGVLSLWRSRIPKSLKVFLTALAILDDLGAILIIAFFYTQSLSYWSLFGALICIMCLYLLNKKHIISFVPYLIIGILLWFCVLKSGVHATLAGVVLALFYPLSNPQNPKEKPAQALEKALLPWVSFLILPLFAFANAGLPLKHLTLSEFSNTIPLGIMLGLFIGKPLGIFGFSYLAIKLKLAHLPWQANWINLASVSVLCGIGFTMSLFIGGLAFENLGLNYAELLRLGVLSGSFLAAITGSLLIFLFCKQAHKL